MTVTAIKDAMESLKQLYVDSNKIEVLFLEEITETIQVRFVETNFITFVTKSSVSDKQSSAKKIRIDDLLVFRI